MALSFLKQQTQVPTLMAFGKLPNRPDFIRLNASHSLAQELDDRIQSAMETIWQTDGWEARYDATPTSDLIYTSSDRRWQFHGILKPSRDRSGRRFPLLAGTITPLQDMKGRTHLVPIAREHFFASLRSHLDGYGALEFEDLDLREYLELNAFPWITDPSEWSLAEGILSRTQEEETARSFGAPLDRLHPATGLRQALLNMAFYRDFLRRFTTPSTTQLIELPLGTGLGETALHASLWLGFLTALSLLQGREKECITLSHGHPHSYLRVSFGRGLTRLLANALGQPLSAEALLDITLEHTTWQAHRLYAQSAYALEHLIEDPELRLAHLLPFLVELQQKIALTSH